MILCMMSLFPLIDVTPMLKYDVAKTSTYDVVYAEPAPVLLIALTGSELDS